MKYGCSLIVRGDDATPDTFIKMAERAEAIELDSLWLSAHVVLPPQVKSGYILIPGRPHPPHWRECYWEPFTVLSFLAAHTSRITLGTSVVVLPMHNPFEVAKQVAEVDQLSGGRVHLRDRRGLVRGGVRGPRAELREPGGTHRRRPRAHEEALADDPVTYKGRFYSCEDAAFAPKPVQRPHPPIWVAGASRPACRRAAPIRRSVPSGADVAREGGRDAQGAGRPVREVRPCAGLDQDVRQAAGGLPGRAGRVPDPGHPRQIADGIKRYIDVGAEHFTLDFLPEKVDSALDAMERFAQEVRPKLD